MNSPSITGTRASVSAARTPAATRIALWLPAATLWFHCAVSPAQVQVDWIAPTGGVAIAVDAADNAYTLSYSYALGAEMSLAKLSPAGQVLWQSSFDQTDPTKWERASWVTIDHAGNAVVCGTLMSGYSNPVEAASIAMKFAPDGALLWRSVYETGFDGSWTKRVLVDATDHIYVLGMGSGPAGFVTKIKKFAPDGTVVWSWFDAAGIGMPVNFELTPDGSLLVSGRSTVGILVGFAKVGLDGATIWSLAGVTSPTIGDAAGDALGNTYVVHGQPAPGGGSVVRKLDPAGALVWQQGFTISGSRVEVDPWGRAIVSGFPSSGSAGAAFIQVDAGGSLVWSNLDADGPLGLLLHAQLLIDAAGSAYLAAGTLFDMAVCKVNSDGSSAWTATVPGQYAQAIALGAGDASVYVVGATTARFLQAVPTPTFRRGDANDDGSVDVADAVTVLAFLFAGGGLACADAADGNDDGALDISDPIAILTALFGLGGTLPAPEGACGTDPTADALSCGANTACP